MSWSTSRLGRAAAVRAAIAEDVTKAMSYLKEPERSVCESIGRAIDAALATYPENVAVKVDASGHQWTPDSAKPTEVASNASLSISSLGPIL